MHGMCFDMLTPMLYISVCRKIYGVIRGKGFAHVLHSARLSLPLIYRMWEGLQSDPQAPLSIFPFSWCVLGGGSKVSLCVHVGIQVGGLFANGANGPNCVLNHMLIPWVSEVIYHCNYLEFGIICMSLTSFYAHFRVLCAQLVG